MFWKVIAIALFLVACMTFGAVCRMADALEKAEKDLKASLKGLVEVLKGVTVRVERQDGKEIEDIGGLPFRF